MVFGPSSVLLSVLFRFFYFFAIFCVLGAFSAPRLSNRHELVELTIIPSFSLISEVFIGGPNYN